MIKNTQDPDPAIPAKLPKNAKLYIPRVSADGLHTFGCTFPDCNHFIEDEDTMILHVLRHVPEKDREATFDQIMKEKVVSG